jgi:hypothetical protein
MLAATRFDVVVVTLLLTVAVAGVDEVEGEAHLMALLVLGERLSGIDL